MVYAKQTWNDDDPSTPLSAVRLNHIEDGIFTVSTTGGGGTGSAIIARGTVANFAALSTITSPSVGDGYVTNNTGHIYVWGGGIWNDLGQFLGPAGPTGPQGPAGANGSPGGAFRTDGATPEVLYVTPVGDTEKALPMLTSLLVPDDLLPSTIARSDAVGDAITGAINALIIPTVPVDLQDQLDAKADDIDLASTPLELRWVTPSWPLRPATPRPVHWIGGPSSPSLGGTTAGGGGMASIDTWEA